MNIHNTRVIKRVIICLALLLLAATVTTVIDASGIDSKPPAEHIYCASAICVYDPVIGKECFEFNARITRLMPVIDTSTGGTTRLVIEASGRECKGKYGNTDSFTTAD